MNREQAEDMEAVARDLVERFMPGMDNLALKGLRFDEILKALMDADKAAREDCAMIALASREEIERLQQSSVESQILASKWMMAHDCLKAGEPYSFPRPADKSNLEKEIERLRAALCICEKALGASISNHRTQDAFRAINELLPAAMTETDTVEPGQ